MRHSAFAFFGLAVGLLGAAACARSQTVATLPAIRSLTEVIEGHNVGGVTIDLVGNLYVADFGDIVWKIPPGGTRTVFATGLYGASGNAIDRDGNLLQSNIYSNSITTTDRNGHTTPFATGLHGPVGLAVDKKTGDVYVANCGDNSIAKIAADRTVSSFAKSDLFKCPNDVALDGKGNLYVVNFRDNKMLKVDPEGTVVHFATISQKGLGHLCFKADRFYVTAHDSHEIYQVTLDGTVQRILGNGERGIVDGGEGPARLSYPNGIACDPWAPRLYINEYTNESQKVLPHRTIIRQITLPVDK